MYVYLICIYTALKCAVPFKQACMHPYAQATEWNIYINPFTATLFFRAWHGLGNLVLLISTTVKYLETIYKYVPHALRNPAAYHN